MAKLIAQVEQQSKQIEEQAMIKELNKQLMHCDNDLQAHMDLDETLENLLGDSEKNLRKTRAQAREIHRERDVLNEMIKVLEARHEAIALQQPRAIVEAEQRLMELRLDEEQRAKERAQQQLDARMWQELQKRKSSASLTMSPSSML